MLKLHGYWRSSSSYRVRIALNVKNQPFETLPVHLLRDGGEQKKDDFVSKNPMAQVPVLVVPSRAAPVLLTQSVAIIEYLDETYPEPPLLPKDGLVRAQIRAAVEIINSGIQPMQNLSMLGAIKALGGDPVAFAQQANVKGLEALEQLTKEHGGDYTVGSSLSLADIFLVPQLYSARRFHVDVTPFSRLTAIESRLLQLQSFSSAHPDLQVDAQAS